ncbi:uncharacterized protein LOC132199720 [Neocloeon triangulifer]|uniref:uncharacterized protein LOC132199720 n=1 Tax=Neocloeon triangulifer TaxID=2078957 RepID=UPI00286F9CCA|nr:uncharacterized protein LOC132199720 [Neocloeon triangulifer]
MAQNQEQLYSQLLVRLRSHSYKDVIDALSDIRALLQHKSPVELATSLRVVGITKILIKIIQKKYSRIMGLALSILSTCALELETRILLLRTGVPKLLMKIKDEISSESVHCRVCRFIGNLGSLPAASMEFHAFGAVPFLMKIIDGGESNKNSAETKQMAIRALRVLGDTREHRAELLRQEVAKQIAEHLVSDDEQLIRCTLKTLNAFCATTDGALQVMSSRSGQGFENLVRIAKSGPHSEHAISCICNMANVEAVRPDLGKVGAISVIFDELKKNGSKSEPRALITALDHFCHECVNRIRIKDNNHFPDLLDLFRSTKFIHLHDIILRAMGRYLYDEKCLMLMVENGLVKVLVCKVRQYIRTLAPVIHCFRPEQIVVVDSDSDIEKSPMQSPSPSQSPNYYGPSSPSTSSFRFSPLRSPSEPSISGWSPAYSSSSLADNENETYSPVYDENSDDEEDEYLALLGSDDEDSTSVERSRVESRHPYITSIFKMLHRISMYDWSIPELVSPRLVNTMMAYLIVGEMYSPEVSSTLCNIVRRQEFLLPLIRQRFSILVYNKLGVWKHNGDCNICRKKESTAKKILSEMVTMTDSLCSRGELSYLLQKGSHSEKICVALSIPYIIRSVNNFQELLFSKEQEGLSLILDLINDPTEMSAAIQSLSVLSKIFQLKPTSPAPVQTTMLLFDSYTPQPTQPTNIVTFKLDDDSLVKADKDALGDASEYFTSMFCGGFRESRENVVRLKETSKASLILLLLYSKSYVSDCELTVTKPEVTDVLDLLIIANKFLILDLSSKLRDYLKINYYNAEDLAPIILWCHEKIDLNLEDEVEGIYNDACAFLLSAKINLQQRIQVFKAILRNQPLWERLRDSIYTTLWTTLKTKFQPDIPLQLFIN